MRSSVPALAALAGTSLALAGGPFGASLDLATLNGSDGFCVFGMEPDYLCGYSVSSAGDVNGDGLDDLIVTLGNDHNEPNGYCVIFGGEDVGATGVIESASLDGADGFFITLLGSPAVFALSVSGGGDLNADGFDDLIVGADDTYGRHGDTYVVFGGTDIGTDESSWLGSDWVRFRGANNVYRSGGSVSHAGDINGDGVDDLIIGARYGVNGTSAAGTAYVVFGGDDIAETQTTSLGSLDGARGFTINGVTENGQLGFSVSAAGDFNADGVDDVVVGTGRLQASYVLFGSDAIGDAGSVDVSALDGTNGFALSGGGRAVSCAGDVNGDGIDDLIIGEPYNDIMSFGETYVIYGGPDVGATGSFDLSSLDGTNGFILEGIGTFHASGGAVSGAGDINNDGFDDVVVSALGAADGYVVYGGPSTAPRNPRTRLDALDGTDGFSYRLGGGGASAPWMGAWVSSAGDINNDGVGDVALGYPFAGRVCVVFGRETHPADLNADGSVDSADLAALLAFWRQADPLADLDRSGLVDQADLAIVLSAWTGRSERR